jgi:co-chaperonin GroES (HSP10)
MDQQLYTSKALWSEGLVMALPQTGNTNASGQAEYNLKQGDKIYVKVEIPGNNTVDLFYGQDNVILKYIGIIGTWYYGTACVTN